MTNIGDNERIEPITRVKPLHLHEKTGQGLSSKDPTKAITPPPSSIAPPPPSLFPPSLEMPPFPEIPPIGPIEPGPGTGDPPGPPIPGSFVYFNGAWWAAVELDCDTGVLVDPYWYQFAPNCDTSGGMGMMMAPAVLTSIE